MAVVRERIGCLIGRQARELLASVNPLAILDTNGKLCIFDNAASCYERALMRMYCYYPKGYVDIPHFLIKVQGIRMGKATELCKRKEYASIRWKALNSASETRIKTILHHMLWCTKCEFNENAYKTAMWEFKKYMASVMDLEDEVIINAIEDEC